MPLSFFWRESPFQFVIRRPSCNAHESGLGKIFTQGADWVRRAISVCGDGMANPRAFRRLAILAAFARASA